MKKNIKLNNGFSLVEVMLALVILSLFFGAFGMLFISTNEGSESNLDYSRASFLAKEGIEAMRAIRDENFLNLVDGTYGLKRSAKYELQSSPDIVDNTFTRKIVISPVYRDASGNIVSAGTEDPQTKKITVFAGFDNVHGIPREVSETTFLTNWRAKEVVHTLVNDFSGGTFINTETSSTFAPPAGNGALVLTRTFVSNGFYSTANLGEHGRDVIISDDGNFAFVTVNKSNEGLTVVNISDPTNLVAVATIDVGGKGLGMALKNNILAVGVENRSGGLALIDVTSPANPVLLKKYNLPDAMANQIALDGNFAYIATDRSQKGLIIVDISDPRNPITLSNVNFSDDGKGICLSSFQNLLFVGREGAGMTLVDVSDPYHPLIIKNVSFGGDKFPSGIVLDLPYIYMSIAYGNEELYVGYLNDDKSISIPVIMDLSNGDANDISKNGDMIALALGDDNKGIIILNIEDPLHPRVLEAKNFGHKGNGIAYKPPYIAVGVENTNEGFVLVGGGSEGFASSGTYISPIIDTGAIHPEYLSVDLVGSFTIGTTTAVQLRSANSVANLQNAAWSVPYSGTFSRISIPSERFVQYKVSLGGNSSSSPLLESVTIKYLP